MTDITQYTVTIKVETGAIGHAFLTLQAPGQQAVTLGYYPVVHSPAAPGIVKNDAISGGAANAPKEHSFDWSKTFNVSAGQYQAMLSRASFVANHPGEYGVLGNQCTGFVYDVLSAGGIAPRNSWIDNAAHPTTLKLAFEGFSKNQVQPWRGGPSSFRVESQQSHLATAGLNG